MTNNEIFKEFPYLKANLRSSWVYGNCENGFWLNGIHSGWREEALRIFRTINPILKKYHRFKRVEIHQIKEKWGKLEIYFNFYPYPKRKKRIAKKLAKQDWRVYKEIREIVEELTLNSRFICCSCGKPAKYRTIGYVLPYCEECIQGENWLGEKLINHAKLIK